MDILRKNLLILASAGSGKTYQLSNRIIGLIARGVDPRRVVALTFTRKAAAEFADTLLSKLAAAASDPKQAKQLCQDIQLDEVDFKALLATVAGSLHSITLGTMDSFFAKVVRGFQYELGITGGRFELIEGPQARIMADEILNAILGDVLTGENRDTIIHAFRRASTGKEQQGVIANLREFIDGWHELYQYQADAEWGPAHLGNTDPNEWEKQKNTLVRRAVAQAEQIVETRKGQRAKYIATVEQIAAHTIGSGSLGSPSGLLESIFTAVSGSTDGHALELSYYKPFTIPLASATALSEMVHLLVQCETTASVQRTRAIRELVADYDQHCALKLRNQGKLGFSDVKLLMGQWAASEQGRLRREAIDFRLDARIHHWLLDEFQDTSRADWNGLFPLIDEAATAPDHSLFIVGDRKQAIYAWRGGDVSLFDDVESRYRAGDLAVEPLNESWRSSPEVLDLVNRVCGNQQVVQRLFGESITHWDCPQHIAAEPLNKPEKSGHARVETHPDRDARFARMIELLDELGVGQRDITCGILTRTNDMANQVADELRCHDYDVIVDGHRKPGRDTPVGIAVTQLLTWLADPANAFARQSVGMSPLAHSIGSPDGSSWWDCWNQLTTRIAHGGYHKTISEVLDDSHIKFSEFGARRARDVLDALAGFDQQGGISAAQAARLLDQMQISQSPGTAAVQVLTIHKSKGLGFDVVILPEIPNDKIPNAGHFNVAASDNWLVQAPPQWVRNLTPILERCEQSWTAGQNHEALCTLYVALTRAKRGLYVLLDQPDEKKHDFDKPSLANLILNSTEAISDPGVLHESGNIAWVDSVPMRVAQPPIQQAPTLQAPTSTNTPNRRPLTPSHASQHHSYSPSGMQFGSEVHDLLESISWIDEEQPLLPTSIAGKAVRQLLNHASCRSIFEKAGQSITLLREQAVDAIVDGRFISGIIDRLHLHYNDAGGVSAVDIIDFKTDAIDDPAQLKPLYQNQLESYRKCIGQLHPAAAIRCLLVSTHHQSVVEL